MKSRDFKQIARDALQGNWFRAIIAFFVASMFSGGVGVSVSVNVEMPEEGSDGITAFLPINSQQSPDGFDMEAWLPVFITIFAVTFVVSIIMFIIGCAVSVGYSQFNIDLIDGCKPKVRTLFSCFSQTKTAVCANILMALRVFFGMLLFFIPGIIMAYSYSMVSYVMAENPELTAREALKESKRIMKGNKWRLFCLEMSFIGWMFLSLITAGIALVYVVPYQQATLAAFYNEAKANA